MDWSELTGKYRERIYQSLDRTSDMPRRLFVLLFIACIVHGVVGCSSKSPEKKPDMPLSTVADQASKVSVPAKEDDSPDVMETLETPPMTNPVEELVSRNVTPQIIPGRRRPEFPADFDWKDQARVRRAWSGNRSHPGKE